MFNPNQMKVIEKYGERQKDSKRKMLIPIVVTMILLAGSGIAYWLLTQTEETTITVDSEPTQLFTTTFTPESIMTTYANNSTAQYIRIENNNHVPHNFSIVYSINETDVLDDCIPTADETVSGVMLSEGVNLNSGDYITVDPSSYQKVWFVVNSTKNSCPATVYCNMTVTDVT